MANNCYNSGSLLFDMRACNRQPSPHVNLLKRQPKQGSISYEFS